MTAHRTTEKQGPIYHYWFGFVDEHLSFGGAWWAPAVKLVLESWVCWAESLALSGLCSLFLPIVHFCTLSKEWKDRNSVLCCHQLAPAILFFEASHAVFGMIVAIVGVPKNENDNLSFGI